MLLWKKDFEENESPESPDTQTDTGSRGTRGMAFLSCVVSLVIAVVLAVVLGYQRLIACVTYTWYLNSDNFAFNCSHMPDVDQGRKPFGGDPGLPGNGGMYCVPSTTFDLFAYIANHGYPEIPPYGPNYWQPQDRYTEVTNWIADIGTAMGTDASEGTTGSGWYNGIVGWLPMDKFTVTHDCAHDSYSPDVEDMTKMAINGSIMGFAYGHWYPDTDFPAGGKDGRDPICVRHGGHIMAFTGSFAGSFTKELYFRDPGNGGNKQTQSTFTHGSLYWENEPVYVSPGIYRTMCNIQPNAGGSGTAYIDEVMSIRPKSGFSLSVNFFSVFLYCPPVLQLENSGVPSVQEFPSPTGEAILDAIMGPDLNSFYLIAEQVGDTTLWWVDIITGEAVQIDPALVPNPQELVLGRKRGLYVVDGPDIVQLDMDDWPPTEEARITPPEPPHACGYDPENDNLHVLNFTSRNLHTIDEFLMRAQLVGDIPPAIPLGTEGEIALDPNSDDFWILTDASPSLFAVAPNPGAPGFLAVDQIDDPNLTNPTSIQVDDSGHLFVCNEGAFLEFEQSTSRAWSLVSDSPFATYSAYGMARVTTNRSSFIPALMTGPGYHNIEPDLQANIVPDCALDPDFLDQVSQWPQPGLLADLILRVNDNCW